MLTRRRAFWLVGLSAAGLAIVAVWWSFRRDPGDVRLSDFVHARPPVPIVFTSRTEPASLRAAAPSGEGFVYPGQPLWQAREGRLRLLTPFGSVHELTWEKRLPDGGTLIDVMSPSVSFDGRTILFAGRRGDDHGHFRLYEIGVDGRGLRQVTGGPEDPGCTALPPMRFAADGHTRLSDAERRRADYDDVDPTYLDYSSRFIAFASSRTPDLGRGHARRATNLWLMHLDTGRKYPLTANRYNDRWPFMMTSNYLAFSLWSRNQEVIRADEMDIGPFEPGQASGSAPVNAWLGAFTQVAGGQFGALVKPHVPVWRPRPLFNGRIVFMTTFDYAAFDPDAAELPALQVVQADSGLLHNVPSAKPAKHEMPKQKNYQLLRGPKLHSMATPSPCPPHHMVLAGAKSANDYGIYLTSDKWNGDSADRIDLTLLFDDPAFVDAEPAAVYRRASRFWSDAAPGAPSGEPPAAELRLSNGTTYHGPAGTIFNSALYTPQVSDLPGQRTDSDTGPIFAPPPVDSIHTLRVYASRRDRFDDPVKPRIVGGWELLAETPTNGDSVSARLPAGVPTVLAGFDKSGRVARWTTAPKDSQGRQATFYAFAGDHYSAVRPGGNHFCIGCHPGHSSLARNDHQHAEKVK